MTSMVLLMPSTTLVFRVGSANIRLIGSHTGNPPEYNRQGSKHLLMVIEDPTLRLAYADHPKMLHRLAEFVDRYLLEDKPALVIQATPTNEDFEADVLLPSSVASLQGVGSDQNSWWNCFRTNYQPRPTFRGVAAFDERDAANWAYEFHRDGHLIAGIWRFPSMHKVNAEVVCLPDFYAEIFEDFANKALRLAAPEGNGFPARLTATLLNAPDLHFAKKADFGNMHVVVPPSRTRHLCWRVRQVGDVASWQLAAERMGAELLGIGGVKPGV
ncbi:hypothetical protein [Paraburkholderia sp. 32]|uniref:hypothetical protein n=1 Tax=Paraburkholderia sp. 32 TaxID=2991057 RepID=UPI003D1972C4